MTSLLNSFILLLSAREPAIFMLLENYTVVRERTKQLCKPLTVEDTVPQFTEYASPPKWHLAHTTWFFEEMVLRPYLDGYKIFNPAFGELFNSYYQGVGKPYARALRGIITRPGIAQVYEYREYVDAQMRTLLADELPAALASLIELGLNHEQQHQELLITDLKLAFAQNPIFPAYDPTFDEGFATPTDNATNATWLNFDAGDHQIGHHGQGFCFDNELGKHRVHIPAFEISDQLVSNGEYLEFIQQGGYANFEYWLDEAWSWVQEQQIQHPMYWHERNNEWHQFTLGGLQQLPLTAPVTHLSYYEAAAYAAWRGVRLPTEFEWEVASHQFRWGQRWEWTCSAYQAYPGFEISAGAVGEYNGKFMVNQMVLRGASVATAAGHSRSTYRNFFHPHHQWQYTGLRLAK